MVFCEAKCFFGFYVLQHILQPMKGHKHQTQNLAGCRFGLLLILDFDYDMVLLYFIIYSLLSLCLK